MIRVSVLSLLVLSTVPSASAQGIPIPSVNAGTFDRVVWQAPDGFVREISKTGRLYFEPFQGGSGATAKSGVNASTAAGNLALQTARNMTGQALATTARIAARASGPALLVMAGLELADIIFDDEEDDWIVTGDYPASTRYRAGSSNPPWFDTA